MMMKIENSPPWSPTTPRLLDLFPCQGGDLARVVSSATRDDKRVVSLAHLRVNTVVANTILTLSLNPNQDTWVIKKKLTMSDVRGSQTRLLIPKEAFTKHIMKYLTQEEIRMIENEGLDINVYDSDENTTHQSCLKRWNSSRSYVLNQDWINDFVRRRNLEKGDVIGLFWNPYETRLHFSVLPPNL